MQSLHKTLEIKLIHPFLLDIVQFLYNVNFVFWTDSNEESEKDKIDANELQRLYCSSDIP